MSKHNLTLVSFSFVRGGAGIAAQNFLNLAKSFPDFEINQISQDDAGTFQFFKRIISWVLGKLQKDGNPTKHSLNLFSYSKLIRDFSRNPNNLYHLHWINNDTLSIYDLDQIPKFSLITLHDEWFYSGAEHYQKVVEGSSDFTIEYLKNDFKYGLPWNYWVWKTKLAKLQKRKDLCFTVPSRWMVERSKSSLVLKNNTIHYLPNCIDTDLFSPLDQNEHLVKRLELGIDEENFVIGFGAIDGIKNPLKGGSILFEALSSWIANKPAESREKIVLLCFGGKMTEEFTSLGVNFKSTGFIKNRSDLAKIYGISDVVLVPSLVESFGQVAAEAMACESPVVCFRTSGLTDIVLHEKTGWLATPFSISSLVEKLENAFQISPEERLSFGKNARKHILDHFSIPVIKDRYQKILKEMIDQKKQDNIS